MLTSYALSSVILPIIPLGLNTSTIIKSTNAIRSLYEDDIYATPKVSIIPSSREPITAPGRLPRPPKTAAIND